MPGLLADVNVQGHLPYLKRLIDELELLAILSELQLTLATFPECGLDRQMTDRHLWSFCQRNGYVPFTDNRNHESKDSLSATIEDSWGEGHLPIITLANKGRFENNEAYALRVAEDVAEILFSVFHEGIRDRPRIFVPL